MCVRSDMVGPLLVEVGGPTGVVLTRLHNFRSHKAHNLYFHAIRLFHDNQNIPHQA